MVVMRLHSAQGGVRAVHGHHARIILLRRIVRVLGNARVGALEHLHAGRLLLLLGLVVPVHRRVLGGIRGQVVVLVDAAVRGQAVAVAVPLRHAGRGPWRRSWERRSWERTVSIVPQSRQ